MNLRCDIAEGMHPDRWSTKCGEDDDGKRLGIQISKEVEGHKKRAWLTGVRPAGPQVAKLILDGLEGRLTLKRRAGANMECL